MSIRHAVVGTTLGDLTLVASGDALAGVYFPHHWTRPDRTTLGDEVPAEGDPVLTQAAAERVRAGGPVTLRAGGPGHRNPGRVRHRPPLGWGEPGRRHTARRHTGSGVHGD